MSESVPMGNWYPRGVKVLLPPVPAATIRKKQGKRRRQAAKKAQAAS